MQGLAQANVTRKARIRRSEEDLIKGRSTRFEEGTGKIGTTPKEVEIAAATLEM